jgi:hypothetical protein
MKTVYHSLLRRSNQFSPKQQTCYNNFYPGCDRFIIKRKYFPQLAAIYRKINKQNEEHFLVRKKLLGSLLKGAIIYKRNLLHGRET